MTRRVGESIESPYPFVRQDYDEIDDLGHFIKAYFWRPGTKPDEERQNYVADGIGAQILTIIGTYKPDGYQERIFYRRQWRDPDGKIFGKRNLLVRSAAQFTVLSQGYRYRVELQKPAAVRP